MSGCGVVDNLGVFCNMIVVYILDERSLDFLDKLNV